MKEPVGKVVHCPGVLRVNLKMKSLRDLKMSMAENTGRGSGIMNRSKSASGGRERLKRQEEEIHRQKEHYEKEKACKRKEEEMKKEEEALWEKGKKPEGTEPVCNSEKKTEKKEVVKRDCIRNKDHLAMQLYQPGARSRNRFCTSETSTRTGDSAIEIKQESGINHRIEGREE